MVNLPETFDRKNIHVVVETPKGSGFKYAFDPLSGLMQVRHELPEGLYFPFNFGFIPGTLAEDGDPLDALVLANHSLVSGSIILCRILGTLKGRETRDGKTFTNDRIVTLPADIDHYSNIKRLEDIHSISEIEVFLETYNKLRGVKYKAKGRMNARATALLIRRSIKTN